ncbi:MAG: penicillin acylase family protein [Bdellovibrionales bacterium]|nr:penicillin acylase family protein [Bdellovibrionales bacterium]
MRAKIRRLIIFLSWGFTLFALNTNWQQIPPLGHLLNPFKGAWQNGLPEKNNNLNFSSLNSPVTIQWDQYGVPHIFAENDHDLYFAQGYLHAKDRLFQMDLAARAGSGRLSELVGNKTIEMDKFFVAIGMRESAVQAEQAMLKEPTIRNAVTAYVEGVNTYINTLSYKDYPIEYKLLNAKPDHFTSLHIAQFLKLMSFRLAGKSFDLDLTRILKKWGPEKLWDLFPNYQNNPSLIIESQYVPKSLQKSPQVYTDKFVSVFANYANYLQNLSTPMGKQEGFNGSNNWAVAKTKTKNGYNLIANDTHLSFSLPSVWYEMQLSHKNFNVYGASFPGSPGIIIGQNNHISWAVTNATMDVMDFYEIETNNKIDQYKRGDEWQKVKVYEQEIRLRSGDSINITNKWTNQGIIVDQNHNKALVLAWTAHRPSSELQALLSLNKSLSLTDCHNSLKLFKTPPQNFICADRNNISITHNGEVPQRKLGQGSFVMNGADQSNYWLNFVPHEDLPSVVNPKEGFVASANQMAVDKNYAHYLGWYYDDSFREQRIKEILSVAKKLSVQDMQDLQNDIHDKMAEASLPIMLSVLSEESLSEEQTKAVNELKTWDFKANHDSYLPSLYYIWWKHLRNSIWQDQLWENEKIINPQASRTIALLKDLANNSSPKNANNLFWIDDFNSEQVKETLKEINLRAFNSMWKELTSRFGSFGHSWNWENINVLDIKHVARIPGFGGYSFKIDGSIKTVAANNKSHGASWKMIVELGPEFTTWTNIPGGVSGNPFSATYQHWLKDWSLGKMRKAYYWPNVQKDKEVKTAIWSPKK